MSEGSMNYAYRTRIKKGNYSVLLQYLIFSGPIVFPAPRFLRDIDLTHQEADARPTFFYILKVKHDK